MRYSTHQVLAFSLLLIVFVWSINGIYLAALSRYSLAAFWAADLLQWIVLPGFITWHLARHHGIRPEHYGFASFGNDGLRLLGWSVLAAITFHFAFFWVNAQAWQFFGQPTGFFALEVAFPAGALGRVVWLYSALTAGFVESVFLIGLPWLLWTRLGYAHMQAQALVFTLASSLVFAVVHWEQGPHVVVAALAFGIVACAWFLRLRTLWPVAIGHVVVDLVAFN